MDTEEALLVIDGHKRRMDEWDDLLAHHAMQLVGPHMKKHARPRWRNFKLYTRKAGTEPEDLDPKEVRERAERAREISEALGPPALLKNKFGEHVTVTRLG